jgi:hypothetical protein
MLPSEQWSAKMCGACRTEVIHFILCGFLFCNVIMFYQLYCRAGFQSFEISSDVPGLSTGVLVIAAGNVRDGVKFDEFGF